MGRLNGIRLKKVILKGLGFKGVKLRGTRKRTIDHFKKDGGFGMNELLGIAAALIIAAFIIIPQLRILATSIMNKLNTWWGDTIAGKIFTNS